MRSSVFYQNVMNVPWKRFVTNGHLPGGFLKRALITWFPYSITMYNNMKTALNVDRA